MMMKDKICRLALFAIVALFAFSSCGINLVVMVGGAGEKDLTGKCIQTYDFLAGKPTTSVVG